MFSSTIWSHKTINNHIRMSEINQNLPHTPGNNISPTLNLYKLEHSLPIKFNSWRIHLRRSRRKEKNQKISSSMKKISQKVQTVLNMMRPTEVSSKNMGLIHKNNNTNHLNNLSN